MCILSPMYSKTASYCIMELKHLWYSTSDSKESASLSCTPQQKSHLYFPFWELRGLSPSFHIHVFVGDLFIPGSGHIFLQKKRQIDSGNIYIYIFFFFLVASATLFDFLFHRFVMIRVHFAYSSFAWRLHGDVDVRWSAWRLVWFGAALTWLWLGLKSAEDFEPYSPMGIDSADTNQPSNGEIYMDKPHLLPNNPARQ